MTRMFCDRCGNQVPPTEFMSVFSGKSGGVFEPATNWQICYPCHEEFIRFIKSPGEVVKP